MAVIYIIFCDSHLISTFITNTFNRADVSKIFEQHAERVKKMRFFDKISHLPCPWIIYTCNFVVLEVKITYKMKGNLIRGYMMDL